MHIRFFFITFVADLYYIDMKRIFFLSIYACLCVLTQAASYSGTLPVLHIQTENNAAITSKEDYINATYYLDAMGLEGYESIGSQAAPLNMEIRGRGNYSWTGFDKKPYRIKLADKQPLLGMNKSKHFALLAHADDSNDRKGFMRNAVGLELGKMIGMTYTPDSKPLEVVLNGDYIGLYFLTETIRVDKDRVNIVEQEDGENDSEKITGGWLVEIDNYDSDPHVTITEGGDVYTMWITYKTPEELSYQQEQYLTQQMLLIDQLVYGNKQSDEIWKYVDMDALAKFYIVQEITDNYESFHGSCYLHKEMGENEKWHFGPVWDFGSSFNRDKNQYLYQGDVWHNHWIPQFCKFPAFMNRVKEIWNEFYANELNDIYNFIDAHERQITQAAAQDKQRWSQYHGSQSLSTYIDRTTNVLRNNIAWLESQWGEENDDNNNGNDDNNDNNDDNNEEGNNEGQVCMYVWKDGQAVEYALLAVDSITFAKKEAIVVKAQVPSSWRDEIYVWVWEDGQDGQDIKAIKQGDWYTYTHDGKKLNIIFKNGKGWSGNEYQTEDIYTEKSACYFIQLDSEGENKATAIQVDCP